MIRTLRKLSFLIAISGTTSFAQVNNEYNIALVGNAFETGENAFGKNFTKETVILNENSKNPVEVYFKILEKGKLNIKIKGNAKQSATVKVEFGNKSKILKFKAGEQSLSIGSFTVNEIGYKKIILTPLQGEVAISNAIVTGNLTKESLIYSNDPNYYYWARRGPSCHLAYEIPTEKNVSYYYNEIKVDKGQDVVGSYFMANGFGEGYFGIQVNSKDERRILFSVWSPFVTDDPKSIPDDEKIVLLKKGNTVHTGEFGNEGSGGQSYLKYNWKADTTYKFLLKGVPNGDNSTTYTAWYFAPENNQWNLIASFKRPKTNTYLKRFHSFLENFIPNQGYLTRQVNFNNQWVFDGEWKKVNGAKLTVDATYRANQRVDATGGKTQTGYFLKMGGFFNSIEEPNTVFKFNNTQTQPQIDFNKLP